jgi:hypothetical protein
MGAHDDEVACQIEKVLSVAGRIEVAELRTAASCHYRRKGFAPPRRVLLELCRNVPGYRVDGTTIIADPPLDWKRVLADSERTLVGVLKERGGVLQRDELEERCLERGMSVPAFTQFLQYSPLVTKLARGVYCSRDHPTPLGTPGRGLDEYQQHAADGAARRR